MAEPRSAWREPTADLPLRFGSYRGRLATGGALLVTGALLIVQTTAYTTGLGWLGAVLNIAGWSVLPARGGRRALAAVAGVMTFVVMLIGPALLPLTSLALALWLLVRERPGISYLVVPLPALCAIAGLVVFGPFVSKLALFIGVALIAVACGWAARGIAVRERRRQEALS